MMMLRMVGVGLLTLARSDPEDDEIEDVLPVMESVGGKLVSFHLP